MTDRTGYRPEIDGLRALAIVPVVLFHAQVPGFSGGYAGVDVFFVISGYLITGIIVADLRAGRFSLAAFYERRARRILPAIFPVMAASAVASWALFTPDDFRRFSQAMTASVLFSANLLFARGADYFSSDEGFQPLLHMWSLGVEEQFYLAYPLLLLALGAWRKRLILPLLATVLLAGFALAMVLSRSHPLLAFYLLPTRMWELAAGAICALLANNCRSNGCLAMAGLVLIGLGFGLVDQATPAPGPLFLQPVLGSMLVILFARPATLAARVLAMRPLVGLGLVSFGLYLWHQPLLALLHYGWFGPLPVWHTALALVAALGLAFVSWKFIEQPVRQRRFFPTRRSLAAFCMAATAAIAAIGIAGHFTLIESRSANLGRKLDAIRPDHFDASMVVPPGNPLPFILYGDSHAAQYFPALTELLGKGALVSENGCLSAPGINSWPEHPPCAEHVDHLITLARERQPGLVIWAQRWERGLYDSVSERYLGALADHDGAVLAAAIDRLLEQLPPHTRLVLVGNSPTAWAAGNELEQGYLRCLAYRNVTCRSAYPASQAEGRTENRLLASYAARHDRVSYADPAAALCHDGQCPILEGGKLLYWDGSHMTLAAARRAVITVEEAIRSSTPLAIPAALP